MYVCSCHITCAFKSEYTLCSWLNVKEVLVRNKRDIRKLSDCSMIQTNTQPFSQIGKIIELCWFTHLYAAFNFLFLSCYTPVLE